MKVVLLARSACKEQSESPRGPHASQSGQLRAYAAAHNMTVVMEFACVGSWEPEHMAFLEQYLRQHPDVSAILITRTDRLFRSLDKYTVAVEQFVNELDLEIHLVAEGQIIKKRDLASKDQLFQSIRQVLARNYRSNLQEEIRKGQMAKAENGQHPGRAPLGHAHGGDNPKAVLLVRVNTSESCRPDGSLESQYDRLRSYAAVRNMTIMKEFVHVGSSSEPQHMASLALYLRQHPDVSIVLITRTDRLVRGLDNFSALEQLVNDLNIEIHLVEEGRTINKDSLAMERLLQAIPEMLTRNYLQNLQEEIRKGQMAKAENGQYPGRAPFGYVHDRDHRTVVEHPTDAATVRLMFSLFATGTLSIKPLQIVIIHKTGHPISKSLLHRILTSRFYLGEFQWCGRMFTGNHPKLVDPATFDRVQKILNREHGKHHSEPSHGDAGR